MSDQPLADAARDCDIEKVKALLDQGASVDALNERGDAAIHWAAAKGRMDIIHLLLKYGADIQLKTGGGIDILSIAKINERHMIINDLEDLIRNDVGPEARLRKTSETVENWVRMDAWQIAHVATSPSIRQKITTIFNFKTRRSLIIADDLNNKARGMTPPESFDTMPPEMIEEALSQFTQNGGIADRNFVLKGVKRLDKPQME